MIAPPVVRAGRQSPWGQTDPAPRTGRRHTEAPGAPST